MMLESVPAPIARCAIYTRKSSNQNLDRETNSLETQRQICAAYITSQHHKGWAELPKRYDDGGKSGADANRPALSALIRDIEAGFVDVVIIYKMDRLTRSLLDFVRLMEVFDRYGVSFVSISQSFDTSNAMGRMIVNILLTFSQFERELIGDRIRDNVRLRKREGHWTGGPPPFGYKLTERGLQVVDEEAEIVRFIYREFLKGGTYVAARRAVRSSKLCSSVKTSKAGRRRGGKQVSGGQVYAILQNPIYVGEIKGHDTTYPGRHQPIISRSTWDKARALCAARLRQTPDCKQTNHFLPGLLWDSCGRRMRLEIGWDRGKAYYYYTSSQASWSVRDGRKPYRAQAARLDQLVVASVAEFLSDREQLRRALKTLGIYGSELADLSIKGAAAADLLLGVLPESLRDLFAALLISVELGKEQISLTYRAIELRRFLTWNGATSFCGRPTDWSWSNARHVHEVAVCAVSVGRSPVLHVTSKNPAGPAAVDPKLIRLLEKSRRAQKHLETERGQSFEHMARSFDCRPSHFSRLVRLNYLAPDIITSILDGTQPPTLTRDVLFKAELPLDWSLQRRLLGYGRER